MTEHPYKYLNTFPMIFSGFSPVFCCASKIIFSSKFSGSDCQNICFKHDGCSFIRPFHLKMNAILEISEIFGIQLWVPCIRFMGNCRKPLFGSVNFDLKSLFFFGKGGYKKVGLDFYNKYIFSSKHYVLFEIDSLN